MRCASGLVPARACCARACRLLSGGLFRRDVATDDPGSGLFRRGLAVVTRSPRRNTPLQRRPSSQTRGLDGQTGPARTSVAVRRGEPGSLVGTTDRPLGAARDRRPPSSPLAARPGAGREHLRRRHAALRDGRWSIALVAPWWRWCGPTWTSPPTTHLREAHVGPARASSTGRPTARSPIFFFVAGLELKRELLVGSLRRPADAAGAVVAACCGVARAGADLPGGEPAAPTTSAAGPCLLPRTSRSPSRSSRSSVGAAAAAARLPADPRGRRRPDRDRGDRGVLHLERSACTGLLVPWRRVCGVRRPAAASRPQQPVSTCPLAVDRVGRDVRERGARDHRRRGARPADPGLPDEDEARSPAERLEHRLTPISAGVAVPFFALMSAGVVAHRRRRRAPGADRAGRRPGLVLGKPSASSAVRGC